MFPAARLMAAAHTAIVNLAAVYRPIETSESRVVKNRNLCDFVRISTINVQFWVTNNFRVYDAINTENFCKISSLEFEEKNDNSNAQWKIDHVKRLKRSRWCIKES